LGSFWKSVKYKKKYTEEIKWELCKVMGNGGYPKKRSDPSEVRPPILILKEEKSRKETSIKQTSKKVAKLLRPSELKAGGEERRSAEIC
jgi:hypothetical protein